MNHIKQPSKSKSPELHKSLSETLFPGRETSQQDLLFFLSLVDAPEQLTSIAEVCQVVLTILPLVNKIAFADSPKVAAATDQWAEFCKKIIQHYAKIDHDNQANAPSKPARKKNPLHGLYSSHPIYCALAITTKTSDSDLRKKHTHLQAHLLYAHICLSHHKAKTGKSFHSSTESAARVVRLLPREAPGILRLLPLPVIDHEDYHTEIDKVRKSSSIDESNSIRLDTLERFFAFSLELRRGRKEQAREKGQREKKELPAKYEILEDLIDKDEIQDTTPIAVYRHSSIDEQEAKAALKEGLDPDENYSGPIVTAGINFTTGNTQKAIGAAAIKIKNQHRYLACANQLLPPSWAKLNLPEIVPFWKALHHLISNGTNDRGQKSNDYELAGLLAAMYWTASDVQRALSIRLCKSKVNLPEQINDETPITYCLKENCWAIPRPKVPNRKRNKAEWAKLIEPTAQILFLPTTTLCFQFIKPWLDIQSKKIGIRSIYLFGMTEEEFQDAVKQFLKDIGKKIPTRLTMSRIFNHLIHFTADVTGDTAIAAFIFGRVPPSSRRTSLYYYAPSRENLQDLYLAICGDIEKPYQENLDFRYPYQPKTLVQPGRIGSNICPAGRTVALLVQDMVAMIDYLRKNRLSEKYLIEFHNTYVSYCLLMLGFMTGYRAVRDPLHDESNIDWTTGFIVICDKDDDRNYNSRITWVPPVCIKQLIHYKLHRYRLIERLSIWNNSLTNALKKQQEDSDRYSWGPTSSTNNRGDDSNSGQESMHLPFFFYLSAKFQPMGVGVTNLRNNIRWCYELPLNSNRHYLRTRLADACVPGEVIDAFMGHWDRGREPFGRFSTFSPDDFRNQLEKPLIALGVAAGWKIIEGLS